MSSATVCEKKLIYPFLFTSLSSEVVNELNAMKQADRIIKIDFSFLLNLSFIDF